MFGKQHLSPLQKFHGNLELNLLSGVGQFVRLHLQQNFHLDHPFDVKSFHSIVTPKEKKSEIGYDDYQLVREGCLKYLNKTLHTAAVARPATIPSGIPLVKITARIAE